MRTGRVGSFLAALVLVSAAGSCRHREQAPAVPEGPVDWSVAASADKSQVQVGEDFTLSVTVRHPVGGDPLAPPLSAFEPFDVIGQTETQVSPVETRFEYRLAPYRLPGELQVPPLDFRHQTASGETGTLKTAAVPVRVVTSLTPDVKDIHDIKSPLDLEVERDLRLLWWLLAALVAALLAYLLYKKLRREPEAVQLPPAPPLPPPDVEAEAALRRLADRRLIENGEILAFETELSEIVKRYVGRRFDVAYLERTTDEVLFDLRARRVAVDAAADVRELLTAADMAKFARSIPESDRAAASLGRARALVEKTRPKPAVAPAGAASGDERPAEEVAV
jgi:BatD DUF11 like domain